MENLPKNIRTVFRIVRRKKDIVGESLSLKTLDSAYRKRFGISLTRDIMCRTGYSNIADYCEQESLPFQIECGKDGCSIRVLEWREVVVHRRFASENTTEAKRLAKITKEICQGDSWRIRGVQTDAATSERKKPVPPPPPPNLTFVQTDAATSERKKTPRGGTGFYSIVKRVKDIIAEQLNVSEERLTPEASLTDDLGADSLDLLELIMAFEEEFKDEINGEIPESDSQKLQTVGQVVEYISAKVEKVTQEYRCGEGDSYLDDVATALPDWATRGNFLEDVRTPKNNLKY